MTADPEHSSLPSAAAVATAGLVIAAGSLPLRD